MFDWRICAEESTKFGVAEKSVEGSVPHLDAKAEVKCCAECQQQWQPGFIK